jgi:hypothetical protein
MLHSPTRPLGRAVSSPATLAPGARSPASLPLTGAGHRCRRQNASKTRARARRNPARRPGPSPRAPRFPARVAWGMVSAVHIFPRRRRGGRHGGRVNSVACRPARQRPPEAPPPPCPGLAGSEGVVLPVMKFVVGSAEIVVRVVWLAAGLFMWLVRRPLRVWYLRSLGGPFVSGDSFVGLSRGGCFVGFAFVGAARPRSSRASVGADANRRRRCKSSAPMHGGQASRAASGGGHAAANHGGMDRIKTMVG